MNQEEILQSVEKMSVLELADLVKALEEKFGVSAAAVGVPVVAGGGETSVAAPVEEKTEFTVTLTGFAPEKKINVIKVARELTGLGLKEAKDLVEGHPKPVKEGVTKEQAAELKKKLEEAGATVEVK